MLAQICSHIFLNEAELDCNDVTYESLLSRERDDTASSTKAPFYGHQWLVRWR